MNTYLQTVDSFKKKTKDSLSYWKMLRLSALYKNA